MCSGPSAWRPASVEAPVAGVDKVADAANSAAPVRMRLRSWLRLAKVARVVDAIDFGPWRNGGGSVPAAAHSLREFQRAIVRWRAGSLPNLGFSTALCGMVQVHRRPTCGGRVNPGYGDPDRRTSVVQLRAMARRRGQLADLGYPVTPVLSRKLAQVMGATDFRRSRSGGGTEPAAARRLRECGRATARRRDGAGSLPILAIRSHRCLHTWLPNTSQLHDASPT